MSCYFLSLHRRIYRKSTETVEARRFTYATRELRPRHESLGRMTIHTISKQRAKPNDHANTRRFRTKRSCTWQLSTRNRSNHRTSGLRATYLLHVQSLHLQSPHLHLQSSDMMLPREWWSRLKKRHRKGRKLEQKGLLKTASCVRKHFPMTSSRRSLAGASSYLCTN
jgi:hypothetical protein